MRSRPNRVGRRVRPSLCRPRSLEPGRPGKFHRAAGRAVRPTGHAVCVRRGAGPHPTHDSTDDDADPRGAMLTGADVKDYVTARHAAAAPHYLSEFGRGSHPVRRRKHVGRPTSRLRQTARLGPCADGRRGCHGRPACACAAGSRASSRDGDYSAGRCACSQWDSKGCGLGAGHPNCGGAGRSGAGPPNGTDRSGTGQTASTPSPAARHGAPRAQPSSAPLAIPLRTRPPRLWITTGRC
jgi:hypothetical protein